MFLFAVFYLAACSRLIFSMKTIEILTSIPYNLGVAPDIVLTGAAFDLAAESVMRKYGSGWNVTVKYLFDPSHRNCDDVASQSARMLSEYRYKNFQFDKCYALVTTPCNDQNGIASLAREFDWLLFNNVLSKSEFLDKRVGSPTAVAVGGTFLGYAEVVLEILSYYEWNHATILVESKTIATFYKDLGNLLLERARKSTRPFDLEFYSVDSSSNQTINAALDFAKQRSRVLILLTVGSTAARILKMADQAKMTNGEYVFFNVQALQSDSYGRASQFVYPFKDQTSNAFRSLFFITYRTAGNELKELNLEIAERSKALYNTTYKGAQPLDSYAIQSSYDIVELFAAVVRDENQGEQTKLNCSGLDLVNKMSNRSFNLSTGPLLINSLRARNLDLDIFGFNTSEMAMQTIGSYKWSRSQLVWSKNRSIDWPTTDGKPPPDIPLCGFSGTDGHCVTKAISSIITALVVCVVLLSGLIFVTGWYMNMWSKWAKDDWQLVYTELINVNKYEI